MPLVKNPSIRLFIKKDKFNNLINILEINSKDEVLYKKANSLKEKLLTFSMPKKYKNEDYVDIRFFPSEANDLILQLLPYSPISNKDFYSLLVEREKRKATN